MSTTRNNKGSRNPMFGKRHKTSSKKLIATAVRNRLTGKFGEDSMAYKGEDSHFNTKHAWIRRRFGVPDSCECCKKKCKPELANIDGNYTRDRNNYIFLCRRCHRRWDMGLVALSIRGVVWKRPFIGIRLLKTRKCATKRVDEFCNKRWVAKVNYDNERFEKSFRTKSDAVTWYKESVIHFASKPVDIITI